MRAGLGLGALGLLALAACGPPAPKDPPGIALAVAPPIALQPAAESPIPHQDAVARLEAAKGAAFAQDEAARAAAVAELQALASFGEPDEVRANAALVLGALAEQGEDGRVAVAYYRQARVLAPDDPSGRAVLALALAAQGRWAEALDEQTALVARVPDDLEAWLLLGEIAIKAGREDTAKRAYASYELRRKGLIDGLTRTKDGVPVIGAEDRAACAHALVAARDNGTALALSYALRTESEASVRVAIAQTMGEQRLAGYQIFVSERLANENDERAREVLTWALAEIERDPIDTRPGSAPLRDEALRDVLGLDSDAGGEAVAPSPPATPAVDADGGGAAIAPP